MLAKRESRAEALSRNALSGNATSHDRTQPERRRPPEDAVDMHRFERLVAEGRAAAGGDNLVGCLPRRQNRER